MKHRTARILVFVTGTALIVFMMTTALSMSLILSLGAVTGIMSSEKTMGISHEAVMDASRFAVYMTPFMEVFFLILAYVSSAFLCEKINRALMKRVDIPARKCIHGRRYDKV